MPEMLELILAARVLGEQRAEREAPGDVFAAPSEKPGVKRTVRQHFAPEHDNPAAEGRTVYRLVNVVSRNATVDLVSRTTGEASNRRVWRSPGGITPHIANRLDQARSPYVGVGDHDNVRAVRRFQNACDGGRLAPFARVVRGQQKLSPRKTSHIPSVHLVQGAAPMLAATTAIRNDYNDTGHRRGHGSRTRLPSRSGASEK